MNTVTKFQVKKLDQLTYRLQELVVAKQSKYIAPKLTRRIKKWYADKLRGFYQGKGLQEYLDGLDDGSYMKIRDYIMKPDAPDVVDGIELWIHLPWAMERELVPNDHAFVKRFEKEVLEPVKYQVVDYYRHKDTGRIGFEIILNITNLKVRTGIVEKPRFLYHFARFRNEKTILKKGLVPRDGPVDYVNKKYKSRIYLIAKPLVSWDLRDIFSGLPTHLYDEFILFRIDTRKFSRFNIFEDLELDGHDAGTFVWTPTHIPSKALKVVFRKSSSVNFKDFRDWAKSAKS